MYSKCKANKRFFKFSSPDKLVDMWFTTSYNIVPDNALHLGIRDGEGNTLMLQIPGEEAESLALFILREREKVKNKSGNS
jgi:hypothetical protein